MCVECVLIELTVFFAIYLLSFSSLKGGEDMQKSFFSACLSGKVNGEIAYEFYIFIPLINS